MSSDNPKDLVLPGRTAHVVPGGQGVVLDANVRLATAMLVLMQQFPPIPQPSCLAIKPEEAEAIPAMNRT